MKASSFYHINIDMLIFNTYTQIFNIQNMYNYIQYMYTNIQ